MTLATQIIVGGTAVTWSEELNTGAGEVTYNSARSERRWLVSNCFDVNDLLASIDDNVPKTNVLKTTDGLNTLTHVRRSVKYSPTQPTDGGLWEVVADYLFAPEYFELSFDTSGATTKLTTAIDEGTYYNCITPGATVPSFNRLVGVGENSVEGVDVPVPKFDFTVLIRNRFATLPATYIETIGDLSGKTNDRILTLNWKDQLFTFYAEELLFLGMAGKMTSDEGFELSLKFSKSKGRYGGTLVTAEFTQPEVGADVSITVQSVELLSEGQQIFIVGGGLYEIVTIIGDSMSVINLGGPDNADPAATIPVNAAVSGEPNDKAPLVIGNSGAIEKAGWRYLWTNATRQQTSGTRFVLRPSVAVVNQVIRTADLSPIGIFS